MTNFDINQTGPANVLSGLFALFGPNTVPDTFASHEDVVLQSDRGPQTGFSPGSTTGFPIPTGASTFVPVLSIS